MQPTNPNAHINGTNVETRGLYTLRVRPTLPDSPAPPSDPQPSPRWRLPSPKNNQHIWRLASIKTVQQPKRDFETFCGQKNTWICSHAEHFSAIVYLNCFVHISPVTNLQCGVGKCRVWSGKCRVWSVK